MDLLLKLLLFTSLISNSQSEVLQIEDDKCDMMREKVLIELFKVSLLSSLCSASYSYFHLL